MRNTFNRVKGSIAPQLLVIMTIFLLVVGTISAWLTHVIHCLQNSEWGFLIAGAILAPIGIIHGVGLWFGAF